jgi:hypothetical protein
VITSGVRHGKHQSDPCSCQFRHTTNAASGDPGLVKTVIFPGMITNKILVVIPNLFRTHPGLIGEHHPRPHRFFSWNRSRTVHAGDQGNVRSVGRSGRLSACLPSFLPARRHRHRRAPFILVGYQSLHNFILTAIYAFQRAILTLTFYTCGPQSACGRSFPEAAPAASRSARHDGGFRRYKGSSA